MQPSDSRLSETNATTVCLTTVALSLSVSTYGRLCTERSRRWTSRWRSCRRRWRRWRTDSRRPNWRWVGHILVSDHCWVDTTFYFPIGSCCNVSLITHYVFVAIILISVINPLKARLTEIIIYLQLNSNKSRFFCDWIRCYIWVA